MTGRYLFRHTPFYGQATVNFSGTCRNVRLLDLSVRSTLVLTVAAHDTDCFVPGARCTIRFRTSQGMDTFSVAATVACCTDIGHIQLELSGTDRATRQMLCQLTDRSRWRTGALTRFSH